MLSRHERVRLHVGEHHRQALQRILGTERHVRSAGFENGQQAHDHFRRAIDADRDGSFAVDAAVPEVVGQLVGPLVEFPVRQLPLTTAERDCLRGPLDLLLEELMNALVARIVSGRRVPFVENPAFFASGEHVDVLDGWLRGLETYCRQDEQVLVEPVADGRCEQVGVEFEPTLQPGRVVDDAQRQVELGGSCPQSPLKRNETCITWWRKKQLPRRSAPGGETPDPYIESQISSPGSDILACCQTCLAKTDETLEVAAADNNGSGAQLSSCDVPALPSRGLGGGEAELQCVRRARGSVACTCDLSHCSNPPLQQPTQAEGRCRRLNQSAVPPAFPPRAGLPCRRQILSEAARRRAKRREIRRELSL